MHTFAFWFDEKRGREKIDKLGLIFQFHWYISMHTGALISKRKMTDPMLNARDIQIPFAHKSRRMDTILTALSNNCRVKDVPQHHR